VQQVGRYRVLRALAQGGMGQVYLAEDPTLERRVAIKLLHRDPNHSLQHD
jgi:serine/threonine protein kinase